MFRGFVVCLVFFKGNLLQKQNYYCSVQPLHIAACGLSAVLLRSLLKLGHLN